MAVKGVQVGWVVMSLEKGKPISTGPIGRQIAKIYASAGRARQVASNYGGEAWQERYIVTAVRVSRTWNKSAETQQPDTSST